MRKVWEHMSKQKMIKIERLLSNGVVHEEYREFENSIFSKLYLRAARQIEKIVWNNRNWIENGKFQKNTDFERSNVISFVGKRGTGKTSAMLSLKDELEEYTNENKVLGGHPVEFFKEQYMRNVKFYTLDCIDVSVLEESENVFILVLANMFSKIQKRSQGEKQKIKEYDNRLIFQKFEKIYEDYISINSSEQSMEGFSTYERLRNAASSQKIRENFAELVNIYLNILDDGLSSSLRPDQKYLVIALDDIDIARRKKGNGTENWGTYKIMNIIYKYLTVPGVIVLTSYDSNSLQERCVSFFKEENGGNSGYEEAALQYIEKIFPIYSRLYMPSLRKKGFFNEEEIWIHLSKKENRLLLGTDIGEQNLKIQKFMFLLLHRKTEVCFDCDENNKHFFEPDTLRTLYNMVELLNKLEDYDYTLDSLENIDKFIRNIEWMEEDCDFRYKAEILSSNKTESDLSDRWLGEPIEQSGKSIVTYMSKTIFPLGLSIKRKYEVEQKDAIKAKIDIDEIKKQSIYDNSNVTYSYAELVHSIFHMTRNEKVYTKKFVAYILYSYTLRLTEIYKLYIWNKNRLSKEQFFSVYRKNRQENENYKIIKDVEENILKADSSHRILESVIGDTIIGKWGEYFFPLVRIDYTKWIYNTVAEPERGTIISYISNPIEDVVIEFYDSDSKDKVLLKLKRCIFISMMYIDRRWFDEESIKWNFKGQQCMLRLKRNNPGDFEFNAFLKHVFSYTDYFNVLERLVLNSLENSSQPHIENLKRNIQIGFDKIWEDYYDWDHNYGNACIPFYNLDITYNMIKKHYMRYEKKNPKYLEISMGDEDPQFLNEYKKMLDSFIQYLGNIDETYKLSGNRAFANVFKNCPFYTMIKELQDDSESRMKLSDYICAKVATQLEDMAVQKQPEG